MLKQVLTLKPKLVKNPSLINERRYGGKDLDFTFKCYSGRAVQNVKAHTSVVVAYCPELRQRCEQAAMSGLPKTG